MSLPTLNDLLTFSSQQGASDLHLSSGMAPGIRVDGEMNFVELPTLSGEEITQIINASMSKEQIAEFEENHELDYSFEIKDVARFRANVFMQNRGVSAVFRTIPTEVLTMEQLGMGDIFIKLAEKPRGIVLVTGPTGSGKSTTLAAMIDYINKNKQHHILTIEDPIEFVHKSDKCLINQREIGRDTKSFANALKSALREDPDVIMVGEMRDLETISLALTAAETGHLVFGTLHTTSAAKTVDRIIDVFPESEKGMIRSMLAESLEGVISQILMKKIGGGRVAAHEIMTGATSIRANIRDNKVPQMYSTIQTGREHGMNTLDQALEKLVEEGTISIEDARSKAKEPKLFS